MDALGLSVLWLVVWFIGIWAIPYGILFVGGLLSLISDAWGPLVLFFTIVLAVLGFGLAAFQFVMQIISVVQLAT